MNVIKFTILLFVAKLTEKLRGKAIMEHKVEYDQRDLSLVIYARIGLEDIRYASVSAEDGLCYGTDLIMQVFGIKKYIL